MSKASDSNINLEQNKATLLRRVDELIDANTKLFFSRDKFMKLVRFVSNKDVDDLLDDEEGLEMILITASELMREYEASLPREG